MSAGLTATDIFDLDSINVPTTILNIVHLTGLSTAIVSKEISTLEEDGLISINYGSPTTFELSDKAKKSLGN